MRYYIKFQIILLFTLIYSSISYSQPYTITLKPGPLLSADTPIKHSLGCTKTNNTQPDEVSNFGHSAFIHYFQWTFNNIGCGEGTGRFLIRFPELETMFDTIPCNVTIENVELKFYGVPDSYSMIYGNSHFPSSPYANSSNSGHCQRITSDWDTFNVTWNTQPTTTTVNQIPLPVSQSQWNWDMTVNVTQLIQDMLDEGNNYGMMFRLNNESIYKNVQFASSKHSNPDLWPELIVTYSYDSFKSDIIANHPSTCHMSDGSITINNLNLDDVYYLSYTHNGVTISYDELIPNNNGIFVIPNLASGYYDIVLENDLCRTETTVFLDDYNPPNITVDDITNVSCPGGNDGEIVLAVTGDGNSFQYSWEPSLGHSSILHNLPAGSYEVTVTDNKGCHSMETIEVTEPNPIELKVEITPENCGENDGQIKINGIKGATPLYTYSWSNSNETSTTLSNISQGEYTLTVTDGIGCEFDTTFIVPEIPNFTIFAHPDGNTIFAGESLGLNVDISNNIFNENYTWTPPQALSCTDCANPTANPKETTTYYVTVYDENGCSQTDSLTIYVEYGCIDYYVPELFSPNSDDKNDHYCVFADCVSSYNLSIFNRWGEMVFMSDSIDECWDGKYKGKELNSGVFVYKLHITTTEGKEINKSGNINLIR